MYCFKADITNLGLSEPGECNDSIPGNGDPNIINPLELYFDNDFKINIEVNHIKDFFKDKENNIKSIGETPPAICSLDKFKNNILYDNYHSKYPFIDSKPYNIRMGGYHKIYNPNIPCPILCKRITFVL